MKTKLRDVLSYPPRGLARLNAARYIGVRPALFDQMVSDGRMPGPKKIDELRIWDRLAIESHLRDRPDLATRTAVERAVIPASMRVERESHVYIVGFADFVKIGWSSNFPKRIREIELNLPAKLTLYATIDGDQKLEQSFHLRFAKLRLKGEWFRREGSLLAWIEAGCPR